ncbi:MAG: adenosylcobinamide-GDP ribazoletransferase [Henriciella sp.]|nr:adenosylcobinamide-GDP ribazoletransferase [Henriciella sp.]
MRGEAATFLLALQFLTRLPVQSEGLYTPARMAASVRYYPLVGLIIGGVSAAVFWGAYQVFPILIAVLLSMAASLLLTGAFHEDGLADTFDGIGGGHTPEKSLEIMKDSRIGTYGSAALVMVLGLKAFALSAIAPAIIPIALVAGHCLSRLSSLMVIATSRYVRTEGTGKPVAEGASPISLFIATATVGGVIVLWLSLQSPLALAYALGGLMIGHLFMRLFFERKLGGYTGDTLGAVQQLSELGFYLGLLAWL